MDAKIPEWIPDRLVEVLPPQPKAARRAATKTCICCRQLRPAYAIEDDSCGICEECLTS